MAGAGYKLFAVGDVLTAAQVNTYLQQQTVMAFANSTARTSALSAVLAEGMMSYLLDTNAVEVYNGSAWVSVGGSIPLTTKGDLLGYDTAIARIPIGTNNQVLTADSAQALGLKWATPSAPAYSGCAATNSSDYTISNGVYTALTFNTERFDTDGYHDTSTNTSRFTVPAGKAGKYLFSGNISFDSNGTGVRAAYIYKNGSFTRNGSEMIMSGTASGVTCAFAHVIDLVVGDYLEARALQTSGGNLSVVMGNTGTTVEFTFMGA
jgi:hypothetical protein